MAWIVDNAGQIYVKATNNHNKLGMRRITHVATFCFHCNSMFLFSPTKNDSQDFCRLDLRVDLGVDLRVGLRVDLRIDGTGLRC